MFLRVLTLTPKFVRSRRIGEFIFPVMTEWTNKMQAFVVRRIRICNQISYSSQCKVLERNYFLCAFDCSFTSNMVRGPNSRFEQRFKILNGKISLLLPKSLLSAKMSGRLLSKLSYDYSTTISVST